MVVGGYFSIKRNVMSIPLGCSVTQQQLQPFTEALLRVFRCTTTSPHAHRPHARNKGPVRRMQQYSGAARVSRCAGAR